MAKAIRCANGGACVKGDVCPGPAELTYTNQQTSRELTADICMRGTTPAEVAVFALAATDALLLQYRSMKKLGERLVTGSVTVTVASRETPPAFEPVSRTTP